MDGLGAARRAPGTGTHEEGMDAFESSPTSSDSSRCEDHAWSGRGKGRQQEIFARLDGRGAARRPHGVGSQARCDGLVVGVERRPQPYALNSIELGRGDGGVLMPEMEPIAAVIRTLVGDLNRVFASRENRPEWMNDPTAVQPTPASRRPRRIYRPLGRVESRSRIGAT